MPNTTTATVPLCFDQAALLSQLEATSDVDLDTLDFGVIGIDAAGVVRRYNQCESRLAGLSPQRVVGEALFTVVAPCMNNQMVAQRFFDAAASAAPLDHTMNYVLALRMLPVRVKLRLLSDPAAAHRYVLVERRV